MQQHGMILNRTDSKSERMLVRANRLNPKADEKSCENSGKSKLK